MSESLGRLSIRLGADGSELIGVLNRIEADVKRAMGDVEKSTQQAARGTQQLTFAYDGVDKEVEKVTRSNANLSKANKEVSDSSKVIASQTEHASKALKAKSTASNNASKSLRDVSGSSRDAGANVEGLGRGTTETTSRMRDMESQGNRLTNTLVRKAVAIASVYVSLRSMSSGIRNTISINTEFEASMSSVRAVTGATAREMDRMTRVAQRLGATTRYTSSEVAEGMRFLGMAGFDPQRVIGVIPSMLDLATVGMLDLSEAADIATNIMSSFSLASSESGRMADVLATTASNANTTVRQMGDAMKYVAPISASLGISVENTAAAIGTLSNAGLQGTMAGTGLRISLSSLLRETPKTTRELEKYGLTLEDISPTTKDLTEIVHTLGEAGLTASSAFQIFGARGAPAMLALTSQYREFERLNDKINDSEGAASELSRIMNDNLRGDFIQMKSAVEGLVLSFSERTGLVGALRATTQGFTDMFRSINRDPLITDLERIVELQRLIQEGGETIDIYGVAGGFTVTRSVGDLESELRALSQTFSSLVREEVEEQTKQLEAEKNEYEIAAEILERRMRELQEELNTQKAAERTWVDNLAENPLVRSLRFVLSGDEEVLESSESKTQQEIDRLADMHAILQDEITTLREQEEIDRLRMVEESESKALAARRQTELESIIESRAAIEEISRNFVSEEQRIKNLYQERVETVRESYGQIMDITRRNIEEEGKNNEELRRLHEEEYQQLESEREELLRQLKQAHDAEMQMLEAKGAEYSDYRKGIEREIELLDRRNYKLAEGVKQQDLYYRNAIESVNRLSSITTGMNLGPGADILGTVGDTISLGLGQQQEVAKHDFAIQELEDNYRAQHDLLIEAREREEMTNLEYNHRLADITEKHNQRMEQLGAQRAETVEAQQQMMTIAMVGAGADILSSMADMAKEGTAAQKAFFIASRAMYIAQAIINTELAATRAMAEGGFILGIPMATAIRALGYASVGLIAGQTIASFEGGGMTPSGPRSGGVDGKGGFLSVLHPNEKVEDMTTGTRNSGGDVNFKLIVNNYSDQPAQITERGDVEGKVIEMIIGKMSSDVQQGRGPFPRSLENTYRLKRGGR